MEASKIALLFAISELEIGRDISESRNFSVTLVSSRRVEAEGGASPPLLLRLRLALSDLFSFFIERLRKYLVYSIATLKV